MELQFILDKDTHMKGIFARLKREEALRLAVSLMGQIRTNNPNMERIEFYPQSSKGYNYFTISVIPEPNPPNLLLTLNKITGEVWKALPEGETPHKRGIRKGMLRVHQIVSILLTHRTTTKKVGGE